MDIIGKVYEDYILKDFVLDGKSYLIDNPKFGGFCNLLDTDFLSNEFIDYSRLNYFLLCNKNSLFNLQKTYSEMNIKYLFIKEEIPKALIFEKDLKRTSYVINDFFLKFNDFKMQSDVGCIFYGDKIFSDVFYRYKKLFIDTAGNNKEDLIRLLDQNFIKNNSIVSVSSEYISNDLVNKFLETKKATIVIHDPRKTIIFSDKGKQIVLNEYYLENFSNINSKYITGLGDKFFLLLSYFNNFHKLNIKKSVIKAQEMIAKYLVKSFF